MDKNSATMRTNIMGVHNATGLSNTESLSPPVRGDMFGYADQDSPIDHHYNAINKKRATIHGSLNNSPLISRHREREYQISATHSNSSSDTKMGKNLLAFAYRMANPDADDVQDKVSSLTPSPEKRRRLDIVGSSGKTEPQDSIKGSLRKAGKTALKKVVNAGSKKQKGITGENSDTQGSYNNKAKEVSVYKLPGDKSKSAPHLNNRLKMSSAITTEKEKMYNKTTGTAFTEGSFDQSQLDHESTYTNGFDQSKNMVLPAASVMSTSCSICGRKAQSGVGGICKGCWAQFQEKGVRIGNLEEFKQFTKTVKDQVSRIVAVEPSGAVGKDYYSQAGNQPLLDSVRRLVPKIFENNEENCSQQPPSEAGQNKQEMKTLGYYTEKSQNLENSAPENPLDKVSVSSEEKQDEGAQAPAVNSQYWNENPVEPTTAEDIAAVTNTSSVKFGAFNDDDASPPNVPEEEEDLFSGGPCEGGVCIMPSRKKEESSEDKKVTTSPTENSTEASDLWKIDMDDRSSDKPTMFSKSKTFAYPDKSNAVDNKERGRDIIEKDEAKQASNVDLKGGSVKTPARTEQDTAKMKVTRAKTEWSMKRLWNKNKESVQEENFKGVEGTRQEQRKAVKQVEHNTQKPKNISEVEPNKENSKLSRKAMSRITISSQKLAKERALQREKNMRGENLDNSKVRYQPMTIKESKDLALNKEKMEEKKKMGIFRSNTSLRTKSFRKESSKSKDGLNSRGKTNSLLSRRKNDSKQTFRNSLSNKGTVSSKGNTLTRMQGMKMNGSSSEEEDEEDDISEKPEVPLYAPTVMVPGQKGGLKGSVGAQSGTWSSTNIVKAAPAAITADDPITERLQKYGLVGDDGKSFLNKYKYGEQEPEQKTQQETSDEVDKSKESAYFEQPAFTGAVELALTSLVNDTHYLPPSVLRQSDANTLDQYFEGIQPESENWKEPVQNSVTNFFGENESSIYHGEPKPIAGFKETGIDSTEYIYTLNQVNGTKENKSLASQLFQGMTERSQPDTTVASALSRDLALGSGESPTTIRRHLMYCENDGESGGLYHIAKRFTATTKFQPFYEMPVNTYKGLTMSGDLSSRSNIKSEVLDDLSYTGALFNSRESSIDRTNDSEILSKVSSSLGSSRLYFESESGSVSTSENTDSSDVYTGEIFHLSGSSFGTTESDVMKTSVSDITETTSEELDNAVQAVTSGAVTEAIKDGSTNNSTKQNRLYRRHKAKPPIDLIIERSLDSAGEFFSKALVSFARHPFNFSNNSSNWLDDTHGAFAICDDNFSQDQMTFADELCTDCEGYTDYQPGEAPKAWTPVVKVEESPKMIDFSKYDQEEVVKVPKETPVSTDPWYAGTENDFHGPVNVTWDGREWPSHTSSTGNPNASTSYHNDNDYTGSSSICPQPRNYNANSSKYQDANNNYPNYVFYDEGEKNSKEPPPPPPRGNDADYAPSLYARCPGGEASKSRASSEEKQRKPVAQTMSYYFDLESNSDDTDMPEYAGMETTKKEEKKVDKAPRAPLFTKVGSITVRNNVENDFDYAENVNRDLADDSGAWGATGFADTAIHGHAADGMPHAFPQETSHSLHCDMGSSKLFKEVRQATSHRSASATRRTPGQHDDLQDGFGRRPEILQKWQDTRSLVKQGSSTVSSDQKSTHANMTSNKGGPRA
ncbi:uncharacterized protein LOC101845819 isoform X2 [Aplysia californica]|uniref:Uncharacterized protein LOC101845819 isoform X2 n=1 Tax=Aplysia californica TaxID=6500 RepID=A0ABM1VZ56_APLCA|nr:uncharacterized protein LOC101845819 isoform X2 [Aplysia californica]